MVLSWVTVFEEQQIRIFVLISNNSGTFYLRERETSMKNGMIFQAFVVIENCVTLMAYLPNYRIN